MLLLVLNTHSYFMMWYRRRAGAADNAPCSFVRGGNVWRTIKFSYSFLVNKPLCVDFYNVKGEGKPFRIHWQTTEPINCQKYQKPPTKAEVDCNVHHWRTRSKNTIETLTKLLRCLLLGVCTPLKHSWTCNIVSSKHTRLSAINFSGVWAACHQKCHHHILISRSQLVRCYF